MKKLNTLLIAATLVLAPVLANAQWSAVRFDSSNTFMKIEATTASNVFVIGMEPTAYDHFFMRSPDGGTTWDSIALNTANDNFQMSEISFPDPNNGYIGGRRNNIYQNLQKTTDNGTTWTDVTPDPTQVEPISALYFIDPLQGWATCGRNLYITNNGGASWTTVALNFYPADIRFTSPLVGYIAGGDTMTYDAFVMKTTDGGFTWTNALTNSDGNVFVNTNNNLDVVDANTIFTNQEWTNKIYFTTDAGATWDSIICDSAQQIVDFHFESADSGHVLTSMGQLFYTNDAGATWNLAYSAGWNLYGPTVMFYSLTFSQGVGYVCGSSGLIKRFDQNLSGVFNHIAEVGTLNVFPSPCYGAQNITVESNGMNGDVSLWIMNTLGEVVYYENIQNIEPRSKITLSSAELATGSYMVVLHNDVQKQTAKLIIAE
jgi:photosystem II stability/assembly factor-like uncharacterized protein